MEKLVERALSATEILNKEGIGDKAKNDFFLEVFSRIRHLQEEVKDVQRHLDGLDELITDKYNSLARQANE